MQGDITCVLVDMLQYVVFICYSTNMQNVFPLIIGQDENDRMFIPE